MDGEQSSESESWGSSWEEVEEEEVVASPETSKEAEAGVQEPYHPDKGRVRLDECRVRLDECPVRLDEGRVRLDEVRVRMDECPLRLGEGPVIVQEGQVYLSDQHIDPTYLTPEIVREADAGTHERHHLDKGRVRMDEGRVRLDERPVRLGEGPVIVQEGRFYLSDQHIDPTYLTPETVRKADAGAQKRHHLDEGSIRMDEGPVRMDEGPVRPGEGPVRPGEGPVVIQEDRVHLYDPPDRHADHTYLTLV